MKKGKISGQRKKRLLTAACILLAAVIVVLLIVLIRSLKVYIDARKGYDTLQQEVIKEEPPKAEATEEPAQVYFKEETESAPATVDWEQLRKINKDIRAWIYAPDIDMSYPVVQGTDNEDYINQTFSKKENQAGTLFFDCRNSLTDSELENWILYGHRMKDTSMFGKIPRYGNAQFYAEHPQMYLLTPEKDYRIEIFACRKINADDKYYPIWFETAEEKEKFLEKAGQQSFFTSLFEERTDCPLISLSTCSSQRGEDEKRILLHGWLVPLDGDRLAE